MPHTTPDQLPVPVRRYLDARERGDDDAALSTFSSSAEVVDDGHSYHGTAGVRAFLSTAGTGFSYTARLLRVERLDETRWTAHHRLEGDFPGGVVDLAYRFTVSDDRITHLQIAP